jgi:hypothetical protein
MDNYFLKITGWQLKMKNKADLTQPCNAHPNTNETPGETGQCNAAGANHSPAKGNMLVCLRRTSSQNRTSNGQH